MKIFIKIKAIIFLLGFFMFTTSFLTNSLKQTQFSQGDIIFVLDVSNSMNVDDVFYNNHSVSRLELGKKIIENNIENIDRQFGLIIFSDQFDYFIPPTLDVETFKIYLKTINTNNLNGGNMQFVKNFEEIQKVLEPSDSLIVISDFDIKENLSKINLRNYIYAIGVGEQKKGTVKDKAGKTLYKNGTMLTSSLNKKKLKEFTKNYDIINSYDKGKILNFLENFQNKNIIQEEGKINYLEIVGFAFIILSF